MSEFEEPEFRGPLFNQLEKGSHLLWEPGQVFEKSIGIDRASFCLNDYLWELYGYSSHLEGSILRNRLFEYIWSNRNPTKILPDFKLNLFVQAKRSTYSSQSNMKLKPYINGHYWYFEITPHQQLALEELENELKGEALIVYAAPAFHKQQDLYNHTYNQTIVDNTTFPKASKLKGHSKWYFDKPGIIGVANPDFDFIEEDDLVKQIQSKRDEVGDFRKSNFSENLREISKAVKKIVEINSNDFRASRFAFYNNLIEDYIESYDVVDIKELRDFMQIKTFTYLWKLNWMTF